MIVRLRQKMDFAVIKLIVNHYTLTDNKNDIVLISDVVNKIGIDRTDIILQFEHLGIRRGFNNKNDYTIDKLVFFGLKEKEVNLI